MSKWIDVTYMKQISYRLERFKEKKINRLWNCKCPICGDSKKKASKTRGYFYESPDSDMILYNCFNCNASMSFHKFLKWFDKNLFDRYILEKFKGNKELILEEKKQEEIQYVAPDILKELPTMDDLKNDHPAKRYIISRGIGEQYWGKIYFVNKFFTWAKKHEPELFKHVWKDHSRIVIPWFNFDGKCFAYSARSINGEEPKYYKIKLNKKDNSYFGMERVNLNQTVYVVEGPVDSLLLPNAIAVGNANIGEYHNPNAIYIPDKDIRNKEILKIVEKLIKSNHRVCMMPDTVKGKDINEYLDNGLNPKELLKVIHDNTFQGLGALLTFSRWKKFVEEPKKWGMTTQ